MRLALASYPESAMPSFSGFQGNNPTLQDQMQRNFQSDSAISWIESCFHSTLYPQNKYMSAIAPTSPGNLNTPKS